MKYGAPALVTALYNAESIGFADGISIFLPTGTVRYTTWATDIQFGSNLYLANVMGWESPTMTARLGLSIDSVSLRLFGAIGTTPLQTLAAAGALDGVRVTYDRLFRSGGVWIDLLALFDGVANRVVAETGAVELEIKSPLSTGRDRKGTREVAVACPFAINDSECGLSETWSPATVAANSTTLRVYLVSVPSTAAVGSLASVSGAKRMIRAVGANYIDLVAPLSVAPAAGIMISITIGCDKTRVRCRTLNNIGRYGGVDRPTESIQG